MNTAGLSIQQIEHLFALFREKNILILGDLMLDSYWWGGVNRISPEAPVPIVKVEKREYRLGGAANVALNIKMLGATPHIVGMLGTDAEGDIFKKLLKENDIGISGILDVDDRPTSLKTRIIANNQQQLIRLDTESDQEGKAGETEVLKKAFMAYIDQADALILQDYDKGVLTPDLINFAIAEANQRSIPVLVDPKNRNFLSYKNATVFKPNLKELQDGLQISIPKPIDVKDLRKAAEMLFDKMAVQNIFITLSELGVYIHDGKNDDIIPSHKRSIYDVSGAGDSVAAVSSLMLACGQNLRLMAEISNIAGGLVCEHVGVVPIRKEWLQKELIRLAGLQ